MTALKRTREIKGLSLPKLSEQTGVSIASLARVESGRQIPSVTIALRISKALNRSIEDLWTEGGAR